jgi:serine/threonine protein kinase
VDVWCAHLRTPYQCTFQAPTPRTQPSKQFVLKTATRTPPLQVKICNFGLSRYSSSSISQGYSPTRARTQEYTSPERLQEFTCSQQDDVYAFGVLLYFIATSRNPFSAFSAHELKGAVIAGKRPDINAWAARPSSGSRDAVEQHVVEAYCDLAQQCWHQEPGQRPSSGEILSQLSHLQHA